MAELNKPFFLPHTAIWKLQPIPIDLDSSHHLAEIPWRPRATDPKGVRETRSKDALPWPTKNPEA